MTDEESKFFQINGNKILKLHNCEPKSLTTAQPITKENIKYLLAVLIAENGTIELQTREIVKNSLKNIENKRYLNQRKRKLKSRAKKDQNRQH